MIFSYGAGLPSLWRSSLYFILLALTFVSLTGCAGQLTKAADYYHSDHPQQALVVLNEGDHTGKRNELLYNFEKGIVLHNLGLYQKSTNQLLKAIKLIDRNEVISINEQVSSLVTTEWLTTYHGEYSERLWAHSYLMMNYLLLGKYDDALVEANQALKRLASHPNALKKDYFTRALIALCFANLDEDNDAYIVYKKLAEDLQSPTPVAADLINSARRLGMTDEVNKYRQYLPPHLPSGEAELVLFIANGQIPKKLPGNVVLPKSIRFSFPYYDNNKTSRPGIKILSSKVYSLPLLSTDLGDVARDCLAARKVKIIAKETLRAASKEAIAQAVGNNSDAAAEALVRVALFLLEEPDTRSWLTLPGRLTLVRIPLPAGEHNLQIELSGDNLKRHKVIELPGIKLRRGQRVFRSLKL